MSQVILVLGGQRSGKSVFAEHLAASLCNDKPIYLATARRWDDNFVSRIKKHQERRGLNWDTIEEETSLSKHNLQGRTVLLDCITLWLTNLFCDYQYDADQALQAAQKEWQQFTQQDMTLVVVSNEIGLGLHALEPSARAFADMQGLMNQFIASTAHQVHVVVAGIPVQIK